MELYTERFVALSLLVIGLSHLLQPTRWSELFADFLRQPYSPLVIGTLTLPLGLFVVLTHNVWVLDWPVVFTICGWGWTVKSSLYLLRPRVMYAVATEKNLTPRKFAAVGALFAIGGAALTWYAFAPIAAS